MKKVLFFTLFLVLLIGMAGKPEKFKNLKNGQKIDIQGVVRLVGNEPFTRLVISASNGIDFYLPKEEKKEDLKLIGKDVRVQGFLFIVKLETPDHKYKIYEVHLSNITLNPLSVENNEIKK